MKKNLYLGAYLMVPWEILVSTMKADSPKLAIGQFDISENEKLVKIYPWDWQSVL